MPTVNTISVREELERLQSEFKRLASEGKVGPDIKMLVQSMFVLFELLVSIFLEKTTKKNSKNSSKPSSQSDKDESALSRQGSKSRGKKEAQTNFLNSRTVESTRVLKVKFCDTCGENLENQPCDGHERRTKIDIVFEKVVEHVEAEVKTCPSCYSQVKGIFPEDMPGPLQYGNGIKAYLINLVVSQMIALSRAQKMVTTLIGAALSENTILKYVIQLYNSLEKWEQSVKQALLMTLAMNCDETSLRVNKKNHWVHVYSSGDLTLKFLHEKRGKDAADEIGILPRYGGVVIHDCWAPYFCYENCLHALCGSHLLRELTFVIESNGYAWAKNIKSLLQETCKKVSKRKRKKLSSREYSTLQKRYRNIISRGEKELPPIPTRSNGKRGKIAKSEAHNLLERLKKHELAVLLFAKLSFVSFTNNRAERDLRMTKVKQKVSGCFRSETLAKAYCRISSYLITMGNRGYNPLVAIQIALSGNAPLERGE